MRTNYLFLTVFFLICTYKLWGQPSDIVSSDGISSPLHQANIGRITFATEEIPPQQYQESDFLTSYALNPKSNLFMTVFMGNSLTNYLHPLAPELSPEALAKKGNYQFSFYVDNRLIHQDNLHPGAPYAHEKHTQTVLSKPLIDHPFPDWWSAFLWLRFMNNGGEMALTEGEHQLEMEIRPYVKNPDLKVGELIASGRLVLNVKKPKINLVAIQDSTRLREATPYQGLPVSDTSLDRDKIKELKAKVAVGIYKNITSIVVLKNGKILLEEYFNQADRNTLHDVRSVGKSFASTVMGMAIGEGFLSDETQTIREFYNLKAYKHYSLEKEEVSLKDLLTMSSAFEGNDNNGQSAGHEEKMYPTENWVAFALNLPVFPTKKGEWNYFTAGAVLLGDILDKSVPGGLEHYAEARLFKPLGITQYQWQYTPQKVANTAGGIQMKALDFAKYGQLYKNGGKWNGEQIIPEKWVNKTFTKHKVIPGRHNEYYGYLFWNKKYQVGGNDYETFYCAGNGGNKIFVFKDQPFVVVVTATAFNTPYGHSQVDEMMENYILPAVLQRK